METRRKIIACFSLLLFFLIIPGSGVATGSYVNAGESIQSAVYSASDGDIIIVGPGTYYEYIEVKKDNLTLRSESGPDETIICGTNRSNDVIQVVASNVTISGFSITMNATTKDEISADTHGICLNSNINSCTIENNNVSNIYIGINLDKTDDSTIKNNTIANNSIGVRLDQSESNILTRNVVHSNTLCGIEIATSDGNTIYNNSFDNKINAKDNRNNDNKFNIWNTTVGNYWSDYKGNDTNPEDGIGDTPYSTSNNKIFDYRPLMNFAFEKPQPSEPPAQFQPVAAFEVDKDNGTAPLTVNFKDLSKNATEWSWDFGDGNQSDAQNPTHIYTAPGNYTVNLTVFNGDLRNSTEIVDYITVDAATSGGGGAPDTNPPVTSDDAPSEWQNSSFTVMFTVKDPDWNATFYRVDGGDWKIGNFVDITVDGDHIISYYSDDLTGNAESPKTTYAKLDTSAPVTTDDAPAGWQNSNFTVNLTVADPNWNATFYRVDGGNWNIGNSIEIKEDGNHSITYYSDDLAGNVEAQKTTYAKLDTSAPITTDNAPAGWQSSSFTVTLNAVDSTLNATFYSVDGGDWNIGNSIDIKEDGNHSITYYSDDLAGNVEVPKTTYARLDTSSDEPISSSHSGGGHGTGSAKVIRKEKLEPVEEPDVLASALKSPEGNSEKSEEYETLKVQENMGDSVEASGSEEEEDGGNIPRFVLPLAVMGLVSGAYLLNRGKKNK